MVRRVLLVALLASAAVTSPALATEFAGWSPAGTLGVPRITAVAALLGDGRVLITGGQDGKSSDIIASTELYDPATNAWTPAPPMADGPGHDVGAMLAALPRTEYPLTVDIADELGAYGSDHHYNFVLDQLLSGLRATADAEPG